MPKLFKDYKFLDSIERVKITLGYGKIYVWSNSQQEKTSCKTKSNPWLMNHKIEKKTIEKLLDIVDKKKTITTNFEKNTQMKLDELQKMTNNFEKNTQMKLYELQKMMENSKEARQ